MKINIIGSILGTSGYDSHTKGLANALYKINPDIKLDVPLTNNWTQLVNDAELAMIKTKPRTPDATIAVMTPPNWRIGLGDDTKKFIGYCVWEGSHIPKYWIEYLLDERVEQIWVPSEHTKKAIWNTYWDMDGDCQLEYGEEIEGEQNNIFWDKVKIVPHGIDPEIFKSDNSVRGPKDTFKFIVNKGWRGGMEDRGGVQYVLQAYSNEFKKDENVELMLKLNPAYINPEQVHAKIDELKLPKDAAPIKLACSNLTAQQIAKLYNDSDCYVCATRAESFDLGTAEAMGCGLPVITTGYGGQIEHMDKTCAAFIDYELAEVKGDVMYEGINQAVPNVQHLQKIMRASFSQGLFTREKGRKAKEFIKDFTWDNTAKIAIDFLK